ncbi:MAG: hypothetical protein WC250_00215 [Candidatus Paceibacterota bacterium]|jgi:hypothetical protein
MDSETEPNPANHQVAIKARELFRVDISPEAQVKIAYADPRFYDCFGEQTVDRRPLGGLTSVVLLDFESNDELVSYEPSLTLSDLWNLLLKQPNGEPGDLLCRAYENGYCNIFCFNDCFGARRAVYAMWYFHGWYIGMTIEPVDVRDNIRRTWSPGHKVFF